MTLYTEPETEFDTIQELKEVVNLRVGDVTNVGTVVRVARGPKYVTVFRSVDGNEIQMFREPKDSESIITVHRRVQTEASREATRRYDNNMEILRELDRFEERYTNARALFDQRMAQWGGHVHYDHLQSLITASHDHQLWAEFASGLDHELESGNDHVGAMINYVAGLKTSLVYGHRIRGISRSTNKLSNLVDDEMNERMVNFIQEARWFGVPRS